MIKTREISLSLSLSPSFFASNSHFFLSLSLFLNYIPSIRYSFTSLYTYPPSLRYGTAQHSTMQCSTSLHGRAEQSRYTVE